jgi:serine/threonine protein kinase/tetratricopeptide (TPR) repeat protein
MSAMKDLPERVGPYRLLRELGSGGMGTVYLAADEEEGGEVALKVLDSALAGRQGFFQRFQREAQAGLRVEHDNVVRTLDYGFEMAGDEARCYLAMEYVEGRTLRELLQDLGVVPEALVRAIARQAVAGLAAIHAAGIVHRDVKPENVLITRDDRVRIMDLGVARVLDATQVLTQEGQFAGSIHYAAPEQFQGSAVGPGADLYALGVVLQELATGVNPFARETTAQVLQAHLHERPPEITDVAPDVSAFLAEVVAQLLEKEPARRFRSATSLLEVLEQGEDSEWWAERQEERRRRKSSLPRVPVRRETALHGREQDLALLAELWSKAKSGSGSTLLVEGEAGIGKSRLVDAFVQGLTAESCHVLYGSYSPAGGLGGLSDAVLGRFGAPRLEAALRQYLTVTPTLVPAFAALIRNEAPPEGAPSLQGDALHAVFVHLMRGLATEKPLLWIVEDLHFASVDTRRILLSLARAVEGHRVLLVVTSRPPVPEQEAALFARTGAFRRTALGRLGAKEVVQLIRDAFKNERLVEKLGLKITEKSDGVPFFVFEMIRGLKEGQFVTQLEDGSWVESKVIEKIDVPSAVKDLIDVRLGDLSKEHRDLVDVGAVHGYEFDPEIVAAVLERRPIAVLQDLAHVERRLGVIRAAGRRFRFDHHQIQEVVYTDMPQSLREGYHALLAEALESRAGAASKEPKDIDGALCVDLTEHFLAGNRGERALRYLDAALTHLEKGYVNERAIRLADSALAAPGLLAGEERVRVLLRRADRLDLLGRREPQRAAIDEALVLARASGDSQGEFDATVHLGVLCLLTGRHTEAREHHERQLALARQTGDRRREVQAMGNLGNVCQSLGSYAEALEHHGGALALAREIGDRRFEAQAIGNLGIVFHTLGRYAEALEHHGRSLALAREIGDRRLEGRTVGNLGTVLSSLGRLAEAREHYERRLALAREIGDRRGEAHASGGMGMIFSTLGRYAEARDHVERHLALAREIGNRQGEADATGHLGLVFYNLNRFAEAREHLERWLALAREIGDRRGEAVALVNLGPLHLALGNAALARRCLDESLALCRDIGARYPEGYALAGLADVADAEGDCAAAVRLLGESLPLRREIGHGDGVVDSLLAIADLRRRAGDATAARAALDEAIALAREQNRPAQVALSLALLATLPGSDAQAVQAALTALREAGEAGNTMQVRLLLWQATHDPAHLAEAKRQLDDLVEHAPPECREPMLTNVRLHREIVAAAREHLA